MSLIYELSELEKSVHKLKLAYAEERCAVKDRISEAVNQVKPVTDLTDKELGRIGQNISAGHYVDWTAAARAIREALKVAKKPKNSALRDAASSVSNPTDDDAELARVAHIGNEVRDKTVTTQPVAPLTDEEMVKKLKQSLDVFADFVIPEDICWHSVRTTREALGVRERSSSADDSESDDDVPSDLEYRLEDIERRLEEHYIAIESIQRTLRGPGGM